MLNLSSLQDQVRTFIVNGAYRLVPLVDKAPLPLQAIKGREPVYVAYSGQTESLLSNRIKPQCYDKK